uniref:Uncharacterized protein n=1 Tax=Haplochromis burtoni TaxID=8153 RepID=A0A3Q3CBK0_HAPBU
MEFILGNPYTTPVGHCIERATDGSLQSEDWTLNMEILTSRDFVDGVLVKIISPKNNPPTIVQDKVLALIQLIKVGKCGHFIAFTSLKSKAL